jgi:hypothetical protein
MKVVDTPQKACAAMLSGEMVVVISPPQAIVGRVASIHRDYVTYSVEVNPQSWEGDEGLPSVVVKL